MNSVTVEYVRFSVGFKYNNQEYQTYLTNRQIYTNYTFEHKLIG